MALRIMSLSGTATETERNWKDFDHVVSVRRNRLQHERASMLVRMYGHLRQRAPARPQRRLPARAGDGDADIVVVGEAGAAGDSAEEDGNEEALCFWGVVEDIDEYCQREGITNTLIKLEW